MSKSVETLMVRYTMSHGVSTNEHIQGLYLASTDRMDEAAFVESLLYMVKDFIYRIKRYHENRRDQEWLPSSFQIKE